MSPGGVVVDVEGMVDVFHRFNFLKVTKEVESLHSGLSHCMFTLVGLLLR